MKKTVTVFSLALAVSGCSLSGTIRSAGNTASGAVKTAGKTAAGVTKSATQTTASVAGSAGGVVVSALEAVGSVFQASAEAVVSVVAAPFVILKIAEHTRTLPFPSPLPSPSGRGRIVSRLGMGPDRLERSRGGVSHRRLGNPECVGTCSLSPRERVRVRGNQALFIKSREITSGPIELFVSSGRNGGFPAKL